MKIFSFDESAYKNDREEFDQILNFIFEQKEKIAICCDKVDRLSRNMFDQRISLLYEKSLKEATIINCAGLGAKKLTKDKNMRAIKGQLVLFKPQTNINYMLDVFSTKDAAAIFLVPQKEYLIVGVSYEPEIYDTNINLEMQNLLIQQMREFFKK